MSTIESNSYVTPDPDMNFGSRNFISTEFGKIEVNRMHFVSELIYSYSEMGELFEITS